MTHDDVAAKVRQIIFEQQQKYGAAAVKMTDESRLVDDLDLDSLSMVELAVNCEDEFGVELPDEEVADIHTVAQAISAMVTKIGVEA